jgi:hypothetical protein
MLLEIEQSSLLPLPHTQNAIIKIAIEQFFISVWRSYTFINSPRDSVSSKAREQIIFHARVFEKCLAEVITGISSQNKFLRRTRR